MKAIVKYVPIKTIHSYKIEQTPVVKKKKPNLEELDKAKSI